LEEREEIFWFIRDNNITGVVLLSADSHWGSAYHLNGNLLEFNASPLHAIPLLYSSYQYPEEHQVLLFLPCSLSCNKVFHPTLNYPIIDTTLFLSDITDGFGMYSGTFEVNVEDEDPWYEVKLYGYTIDGYNPVEVFSVRQHVSETAPVPVPPVLHLLARNLKDDL
jgi:hypothetical protein